MLDSILLQLLIVTATAAIGSALLIPLASTAAIAIGLVDKPDARRKLHQRPIPLVGGIVIFATTVLTSLVFITQFSSTLTRGELTSIFQFEHLGLLLAAGFLLLVGIVDDRFKIRGHYKLLGQIIAATILIAFGYYFDQIKVSRWEVPFGVFSVLIVYFWLLGAVNSVNLLDGADGFAGTLGLITSLSIAIMAIFGGVTKTADAVIAASLAGSLIGFLLFNLPPAKIYLGDAGSMLIGLTLGALAISTALKEQTFYALVAPIAVLSIPIMDSGVAIIRRKMTGRGIYAVDRGHIHHSLLRQGLSPKMAVLWMAVLCGTTAMGGVLSFITRESEFALISVVLVVGFLIAGRIFGFAEFRMVGRKVTGATLGFVLKPKDGSNAGEEFQLQGTRDWGRLFSMIRQFAAENEFSKVTLDINAPWIHESYHGTWKAPGGSMTEGGDEWEANIPLILDNRLYGRIRILADGDECHAYRSIPKLITAISEAGDQLIQSQPIVPRPAHADETANSPSSADMVEGSTEENGSLYAR